VGQWLHWVELGQLVGMGVGVNSVEDSVEDTGVGTEGGSLKKNR